MPFTHVDRYPPGKNLIKAQIEGQDLLAYTLAQEKSLGWIHQSDQKACLANVEGVHANNGPYPMIAEYARVCDL